MSFARRIFCFAIVLLMSTACDADGTGPGPGNEFAASTYTLASVSGRGPVSGILMLTRTGQAERRVRFAQTGGTAPEYVARGSYRMRADGTIDLQLREDDGRSEYVWRPVARLIGLAVELRYPDPADGPDIVERYERL